MRIDFECAGGYGGLQLRFKGDTRELPPDVADDLERAVAESGIWDLGERDLAGEDGPPDVFSYRLSLWDGDNSANLSVTDVTAPQSIRPLLAILRKLALREPGSR
jgi:emfourin